MELSTGQQRLLFVIVVLLLAGLGIYLVGPDAHHGAQAAATATPTPSPSSAPASVPPATVPPYTPPATPAGTGGADIYQWLPFTQQDLTQAARNTVAFAADYETFSYTETAPVYAQKMAGVVTSELSATLQNGYATPGVAAQRAAQKQVSTSTGTIVSVRSFGAGSITFLVTITQQLATTKGSTSTTTQYAITAVSQVPGSWQVNDIELANAGNT